LTGPAPAVLDGIPGSQLSGPKGAEVFLEATARSGSADDIRLSLQLRVGKTSFRKPAEATATSVELTLDVCAARVGGAEPVPLSADDKVKLGRFLQVRSPGNPAARPTMIVPPPHPPLPAPAPRN